MLYTFVVAACVFAGVAMLASLHTLVAYNRFVETCENWGQSLSDDCNSALNARYQVLVDAMKKDVKAAFDEQFGARVDYQDLTDVEQYISENDVKINV